MPTEARFRLRIALMVAVAWAMGIVSAVRADLIAGWDFQTTTNGVGTAVAIAPDTPTKYVANFGISAGVATIHLDGTHGSDPFERQTPAHELNSGAGTTLNAGEGFSTATANPAALTLLNSTANDKSMSIAFSMAGHEDLVLSYATRRNSTGFNSNKWTYSIDGKNWFEIPGTIIPTTDAYGVVTVDMSNIAALNNAQAVLLRYTIYGASEPGGYNRIDNLQLNALPTPEPGGAVAVLGGAAALLMRRGCAKHR